MSSKILLNRKINTNSCEDHGLLTVTPKKRKLSTDRRKWSQEEAKSILEYARNLFLNGLEFEKPSAPEYYEKCLTSINVESLKGVSTEKVVQFMKTQRNKYAKAIEWRNKTGEVVRLLDGESAVTVPPREPIIKDETGSERTPFVGPYTEGSSLTLHCHTDGGNPLPRVVWYRNGKLIDTSDYYEDGVMKNDLTITILARSDLHAELTCETSNNNISRPLATTVHLDMNFSPLDVTILEKPHRITAGRKYELTCQSVGSRPAAQISWWLDDQRLEASKQAETSKDGNTTKSTLAFIPRKRDSKKYMACRAENSIIPSKVLEDGWNLEIHYLPEARLKLGASLSGEHIKEHSDVYFDCIIDANPPVSKVEWRHNNKVLSHNISANVIMTNQSLVLQKVTRLSAGNYTCIGRNSEGEGESQPFYLDVLYSPACRPNQMRVHGVAKMENANISCDVDANPPKVQFRWTFNNSAESIEVPTQRYKSFGTRSVVTYTPQTELDYGTLLCWATNKIGDQRVPCVYHIIAAGRPDSVHNCSVANHSTESFFLHCNEGFNGGLQQSFVLELYETQSHKIRANITTSVPVFSVNGLEPGQSFLAHVYAFNNKGRSELYPIPVFTIRLPEQILTKIEEPRSAEFQLTQTLSILIGVVTALIIVSIAIILLRFYCSRRRTRDRRRREKASTPLKMDAPDGCDSDEKNPDVIPQDSDEVEYYRKRQQHISTIDTSPARVAPGGLSGYCTLRNGGIPLQDLNNIGSRPKFMGPDGGYSSGGYAGCPTLPRHHHHAGSGGGGTSSSNSASGGGHVTHIMDSHVSVNSSGHSTHSLEWPTYQGAAGVSRRQQQQQHMIIPPPPGPPGERGRLTSFRPNSASPSLGGSGGGGNVVATATASTQSQSVMTYDMPPLLQIPVLEEEADLTEMPLMSDKIESTV